LGERGSVAGTGQNRNVYGNLLGKPEGKRLPGRPRSKREYDMNTDLK
jgi:hypothetical protein